MACAALLGMGRAAAFPALVGPDPVVEYYNTFLGHYFMTINPVEMEDIEAGKAGPGWVKTGFAFRGCALATGLCLGSNSATVKRFYGTPGLGPNSHFYTADPAEAQGLERPGTGWTLEGIAFGTAVPEATGHCAAGTPVIRLYNQRSMFNDSNHRYVTSDAERARMVAQGWVDEGVRFCSDGAVEVPIKRFAIENRNLDGFVRPSAQCEDETLNIGPCVAVNNLPAPASLVTPVTSNPPADFFDRTGFTSPRNYVVDPSQPASTAAQNAFVQGDMNLLGIHVDTRDKGANALSSVNPLYQLHSTVEPGRFDQRFFPFGKYESDVQLSISFTLNVKTLNVRSAGGAAYGHPTVEFIDQKSGHHLYFTVLTYGTVPVADYLAPDVGTGKVIVGTTFRDGSPYGRNFGLPTLPTPSGFQAPNFWGWGGAFEFRMDRGEFQRVVNAARSVDAALSAEPADYLVDNFHFNNEVFGDGEIGINLTGFKLELLRR